MSNINRGKFRMSYINVNYLVRFYVDRASGSGGGYGSGGGGGSYDCGGYDGGRGGGGGGGGGFYDRGEPTNDLGSSKGSVKTIRRPY